MPTEIPDHVSARRRAYKILNRVGVSPGLRALAHAYMFVTNKQNEVQGVYRKALQIVFEGLNFEEDVYVAARQVRSERSDLVELKARLRNAITAGDMCEIAGDFEPLQKTKPGDVDYSQMSPGIRDTVRRLRSWGYETTDSGDGTNLEEGMECGVACPMVSITVATPTEMVAGVRDIFERMQALGVDMYGDDRGVQGTMSGVDMLYTIQVYGVNDAAFTEKQPGSMTH